MIIGPSMKETSKKSLCGSYRWTRCILHCEACKFVGQVENTVVLKWVSLKSSCFGVLLPVAGFSKLLITKGPNVIIGSLDVFISEWHYLEKRLRRERESLVCAPGRTDFVIHLFLSVSPSYHEVVSFATQLQCYNVISHLKTQGKDPIDIGLKLWKWTYKNLCTFKPFLSRYLSQRKKKMGSHRLSIFSC